MVVGLLNVNASIWMCAVPPARRPRAASAMRDRGAALRHAHRLLRGGGIVFVALMKNYILGDKLKPAMWVGVGVIGVAVVMAAPSVQ